MTIHTAIGVTTVGTLAGLWLIAERRQTRRKQVTLNTRVYVLDQVDSSALFREAQRLLGLADEHKRGAERQEWSERRDSRSVLLSNAPGQDLPGWLMVHHGLNGMYRTTQEAAVHECCNHPDSDYYQPDWPACTETEHDPACWVELSIDTAYGYRGPNGYGCGDLHAAYVAALGEWLDARSIRWKWQNEFTGEIHEGYERLIELASGGFEAAAWFRTSALPAIAAQMSEGR